MLLKEEVMPSVAEGVTPQSSGNGPNTGLPSTPSIEDLQEHTNGSQSDLMSNLEQAGESLCLDDSCFTTYSVKKGENLTSIAKRELEQPFTLNDVVALNKALTPGFNPDQIDVDQIIFLPALRSEDGIQVRAVSEGDTLSSIALRHAGSTDFKEIIALNKEINPEFNPNKISPGQPIYLPKLAPPTPFTPEQAPLPTYESYDYTVKAGDTLTAIALRELGDVKRMPEIVRLNQGREGFNKDLLQIGDTIILPGSPEQQQALLHPFAQRLPGAKLPAGESFYSFVSNHYASRGEVLQVVAINRELQEGFNPGKANTGEHIVLPPQELLRELREEKITFPIEKAKAQLRIHEGYKTEMYYCTAGHPTIGIGHNLSNVKGSAEYKRFVEQGAVATSDEIDRWFRADIARSVASLNNQHGGKLWYHMLDEQQRLTLLDMSFNMGERGLNTFKNFHAALERGDYSVARDEMLESKWAGQVGMRANTLALMMLSGDSAPLRPQSGTQYAHASTPEDGPRVR